MFKLHARVVRPGGSSCIAQSAHAQGSRYTRRGEARQVVHLPQAGEAGEAGKMKMSADAKSKRGARLEEAKVTVIRVRWQEADLRSRMSLTRHSTHWRTPPAPKRQLRLTRADVSLALTLCLRRVWGYLRRLHVLPPGLALTHWEDRVLRDANHLSRMCAAHVLIRLTLGPPSSERYVPSSTPSQLCACACVKDVPVAVCIVTVKHCMRDLKVGKRNLEAVRRYPRRPTALLMDDGTQAHSLE